MSTTFEEFSQTTKEYNTIPLFKRFFLDTITPIQIFHKLKEQASFILESKDNESEWANFSFIGINPYVTLQEKDNHFIAKTKTGSTVAKHKHFREALLQTIKVLQPQPIDIDIPFSGGGVGYISYDGISEFENKLSPHPTNDLNVPRFHFSFCETIIAYDHEQKEVTIITHVFLNKNETLDELKTLYDNTLLKINKLISTLLEGDNSSSPLFQMPKGLNDVSFEQVKTNFEKADFLNAVKKVKHFIEKEEILQAVISQRFEREITVSGLEIYRVLRTINPSPYLFYLKIDDFEVVGSSPEKLIQINGEHIEIHPIAGTRPRGKTRKEDEQLATELLNDKKERDEHMMLVDLAKKEISRVGKPESVEVPSLMEVGFFSHVMHIISKVTGKLADDSSPIDALISAFPAGTLSGAPKLRAMQIINEIEPMARNLYGGAIGYIGFDGNIDSCITIRSIFIKNNKAYIQAGAGIVEDSIPENEWEETKNKAKALIKAIEVAEQLFNKEGVAFHV